MPVLLIIFSLKSKQTNKNLHQFTSHSSKNYSHPDNIMNNVHLVWNLDLATVSHSPLALPAVLSSIQCDCTQCKVRLKLIRLQYLLISTCFAGTCASTCMEPFWPNLSQEKKKINKFVMAMNTTQSLIVSPSFCHSSPRCSGAFPKCVHRSPNHEGNRVAPGTTGHPHQPSLSSATAAQGTEVAE